MRRVPTPVVLAALLLGALLLAAVAGQFASTRPDGLERVAQDQGFSASAEEHVAGDAPLADYRARGLESSSLAGGIAGVSGAVVVLLLAGGLAYVVRRRAPAAEDRR